MTMTWFRAVALQRPATHPVEGRLDRDRAALHPGRRGARRQLPRSRARRSKSLKAMANDRLQAFGTANKAVFAILDASLTRDNDMVTGSFAVSLTILDDNGTQLGFAEARVQSRHTGRIDDLRSVLYDMTKALMSDMNIEFEYQIRQHLKPWLTTGPRPPRRSSRRRWMVRMRRRHHWPQRPCRAIRVRQRLQRLCRTIRVRQRLPRLCRPTRRPIHRPICSRRSHSRSRARQPAGDGISVATGLIRSGYSTRDCRSSPTTPAACRGCRGTRPASGW